METEEDFGFVALEEPDDDFGFVPFNDEPDRPAQGFGDLKVAEKRQDKRAELESEMQQARVQSQASDLELNLLDAAQRTVEPLTASGMMNQPSRAFRAPDPFQTGKPVIDIPEPSGESAMAGVGKLASRFAEGLTTPESIVTLAGAGPRTIGGNLVKAAFGTEMVKHLPEQAATFGETFGNPQSTPSEKVLAVGEPALAVGMVGLLAKSALPKAAKLVEETAKKTAAEKSVEDFYRENPDKRPTTDLPGTVEISDVQLEAPKRTLTEPEKTIQEINAKAPELAPDPVTRFQEIEKAMEGRTDFDSPEYQALWKEREQLKNQNGGMPPINETKTEATKLEETKVPDQTQRAPDLLEPEVKSTGASNDLGTPEQARSTTPVSEPSLPKWTKATETPVKDLIESAKETATPDQTLGIAPPGTPVMNRAFQAVKDLGKAAVSMAKMDDLKKSTLNWSATLQKSFGEIKEAQKSIEKVSKKPIRREAITNWIEANGDINLLKSWEAASSEKNIKEGYRLAQSLTPEELTVAKEVKAAFDALHARGKSYDILDSFRDNYVNHIWNRGLINRLTGSSRRLKDKFRFSKQRTFENFFQGEQAGFKPTTKDIAKLLPVYIHEMNNVIAAKQLVEAMSKGKASDGRPLVAPRGNAKVIADPTGKATLIFPDSIKDQNTLDYKILNDHPALNDWRWVSKDDAGNPVFLKSDLALHPEAYSRVRNMLGQSEIRKWYNEPTTELAEIPKVIVQGLDQAQAEMKKTMLGLLSTFHQVQEGTHAIGHKINPFSNIPKIDLSRDAKQMDAARHGLMLNPDRVSERVFSEGLGQTGIISKIPILGKLADTYADYLFHDYIPGLKFKTYEHILERNLGRYKDEIASGKVKESDVKLLSSEQTNAAFGHLNYVELNRNPTIQHILQLSLLAPDFLEARGRFVAQAAKAIPGFKTGREQMAAIALLAAIQFGTSRIINKLADDEWHFDHPFEVIVGGRRYIMRSVPEDIFALIDDPRRFSYGRVNPMIGKGAIQGLSGVNYRGEKVSSMETLGEIIAQYIPLTARWIPGVKDLTQTSKNRPVSPLQELSGTIGLRISRYSPISETYKRASEWKEKAGLPKDRGTYPISKYQQLRYALEDGDINRAQEEYKKLLEEKDATRSKIAKGFKMSIHHPFADSEANEKKFRDSLDEKGKHIYDLAQQKRKDIYNAFIRMPK